MKLKRRPNNSIDSQLTVVSVLVATLAGCWQLQNLVAGEANQNNHLTSQHAATPNREIGWRAPPSNSSVQVRDLSLAADFRAVKLAWSYDHDGVAANEPTAFLVRFCELTSWNIEIKCRHKDMPVVESHPTSHSTVIRNPPHGNNYEAQIFDLRALTNYTFQVQVSRFSHQPQPAGLIVHPRPSSGGRGQAGRLLRNDQDEWTQTSQLIETKPFKAEATKCLADSSEVLIHTGRFFGGRISVEDSTDPRCSLLGNRTSDQSSYLFRIDHQVCGSKMVDGKRIETMVLVHENKDILTHNTARFLMLCNFLQKSFTLRASISLPKVNGLMRPSTRPALITTLPGKPSLGADQQPVMLGSMPGFYRVRSASSNEIEPPAVGKQAELNNKNEVETDLLSESSQRVAKTANESVHSRRHSAPDTSERGRARALSLFSSPRPPTPKAADQKGDRWPVSAAAPPPPIEVQSRLLFVENAEPRSSRQRQSADTLLESTLQVKDNLSSAEEQQVLPAEQLKQLQQQQQQQQQHWRLQPDEQQAVVKTNNHRVSADLAGQLPNGSHANAARRSRPTAGDSGYTIKYSAAEVNEYSIGNQEEERSSLPPTRNLNRTLYGRMRAVEQPAHEPEVLQSAASATVQHRMGEEASSSSKDAPPDQLDLSKPSVQPANGSLAHNITSYLLKWSLKTLTNLARKSLESLTVNNAPDQEFADLEISNGSRWSEPPTTTTRARDAADSASLAQPPTTTTSSADGIGSNNTSTNSNNMTTKRPKQAALATSATPAESTTRAPKVEPTTKSSQERHLASGPVQFGKPTESLIDGFIAESNKVAAKETPPITTMPAPVASSSKVRPTNYSKSLDLNREASSRQAATSERIKVNASAQRKPLEQQHQLEPLSKWTEPDKETSGQFGWLICSLAISAALVVGVFLTLWLLPAPSGSTSRQQVVPAAAERSRAFNHEQPIEPRYDYGKFAGQQDLLASKATTSTQSSDSSRSSSASNSTWLVADEHNCRNSEFLFTDHVLIDTGSSHQGAESYA